MNLLVMAIDGSHKVFEYYDNDKKNFLNEINIRIKNEKVVEENIKGKGYYLRITDDNYLYGIVVDETSNRKDAKYLAKHFLKIVNSSFIYRKYKEDLSVEIDKLVLHNTKNINNSINMKLLNMVRGDELHQHSDKLSYIKKQIQNNQSMFAREILNLFKFSTQIQFEYTMMLWLNPNTSREYLNIGLHKIYKVVELAKYVCEDQLLKRKINVVIERSEEEISCDFDILKSCLSQLFENCSKYCREGTDVEISFSRRNDAFVIDIEMVSLYHEDDELEDVFLPGRRGKQIEENGFRGSGMGLYIVQQLLGVCSMSIKFAKLPDNRTIEHKGIRYSKNMFVITMPL